MNNKVTEITITLTRYAEPNWLLFETLEALSKQTNINAKILFLDQIDCAESRELCEALTNENLNFVYENIEAKSLSYARNKAIELCSTNILLYIDTDAIPEPNWAENMSQCIEENGAAIVGGKIKPKWHKTPGTLQKSKLVLEQYSMLDLGEACIEVSKIVGASFGIHLGLLKESAYFDLNMGRTGGKLLGGEETDLCARAAAAGFRIFYVGTATVYHQVLPERVSFAWISKRFYYGGISRANRGGKPQPFNNDMAGFSWPDYFALALMLPFYLSGMLKGKLTK